MGVLGCPGIAKPSSLLLQSESVSLCFRLIHSNPFPAINLRGQKCGRRVVRRACAPKSMSLAAPSAASPLRRRRFQESPSGSSTASSSSSSLYARPSLRDMKAERDANRARVYEFLRGLGIVPDELDGLEMPVTAEVMRERVDFLHSLGLTVEDINNYPLVLGCSVKKNMIPVLDYLGKLGVSRSTLTDFLRRYPQVLHSSVVVDLAPVVKYLQGMDIKPNDIPRVLKRYPEVLGFKLEGTMSTSVAYLVGIGVARRQIGGVLTQYPEILGMRVGKIIKPFVEYLETLGIPRLSIARLIEKKPYILGFDLRNQIKPNVDALLEFNVRRESLASALMQYPEIIGMELKPKLLAQKSLLESITLVGTEDFGRVIEKMPQVVSLSRTAVLKHVEFFQKCGLSLNQVKEMVVGCPQILALNIDVMRMSFEYFQEDMDRDLEDLVVFPAFFTYGLESTIKPRHKIVSKKGLKCSLGWLLNCTDAKFEERMTYDSIGIEEMDQDSSSGMYGISELSDAEEAEESELDYESEATDDEYI